MLRTTATKICITTEDIQQVKDRLSERSSHVEKVVAFPTVHAAHYSQNARPKRYFRGIVLPGPAHSRDDAFVVANTARADTLLSIAVTCDEIHECSDVSLSPLQSGSQNDTVAETRASLSGLAGSRCLADQIVNNLDWRPQPLPCTAPGHTNSQHFHGTPSGCVNSQDLLEGLSSPRLAAGVQQQRLQPQPGTCADQGYDGSDDRYHPSQRGGDEYYSHNGPFSDYELPHLPTAQTQRQFTPTTQLDPLAPTFVPRVRFGSADDQDAQRRAVPINNGQRQPSFNARSVRSENTNHRQSRPVSVRTEFGPQPRVPVQGSQHIQTSRMITGSRSPRHYHRYVTPLSPSTSTVMNTSAVINHQPLSPADLPNPPSNSSFLEARESSDRVPVHVQEYTRRNHTIHDRDIHLRTLSWSQQDHSTDSRTSSASFSVPNFLNTASRAPVIYSRHSSLMWSRGASNGPVSRHTGEGAPNRPMNRREPSYSFYLEHSPLDELTGELRHFSEASSARRSSGGSNPMRPFRGNLLSGGLFYSEDLYSEDQQSGSEPEQRNNHTTSPSGNLGLSAGVPADRVRYRHHPALDPVIIHSSSPQSLLTLPQALANSLSIASSGHSDSSPLPIGTSSPARLSPVTSGPSYSLPIDSMLFTSLSPSSPSAGIPSDPPISIPQTSSPVTPPREGVHGLSGEVGRSRPYFRQTFASGLRIYADELPAAGQPQTPADISKRRSLQTTNPRSQPRMYNDSTTPSPIQTRQLDAHPATRARPIREPTTAELTVIPFLSPAQTARQSRSAHRRGRGNRSTSDEQENDFDLTTIPGMEDEGRAWLRRIMESDRLNAQHSGRAHDDASLEITLDETPPCEGRFERMMRD